MFADVLNKISLSGQFFYVSKNHSHCLKFVHFYLNFLFNESISSIYSETLSNTPTKKRIRVVFNGDLQAVTLADEVKDKIPETLIPLQTSSKLRPICKYLQMASWL